MDQYAVIRVAPRQELFEYRLGLAQTGDERDERKEHYQVIWCRDLRRARELAEFQQGRDPYHSYAVVKTEEVYQVEKPKMVKAKYTEEGLLPA